MVRFVALGFGSALVPRSAATTRPDDVAVVELADPAARHPISLVHRHPAPTAPSARAFLALLAASERSSRRGQRENAVRRGRFVGRTSCSTAKVRVSAGKVCPPIVNFRLVDRISDIMVMAGRVSWVTIAI